MNFIKTFIMIICSSLLLNSCADKGDINVAYLHHSTGQNVWYGDHTPRRFAFLDNNCMIPRLINEYNTKNDRKITIKNITFPTGNPYPWQNYPYDYYNIWVANGNADYYQKEPSLSTLCSKYDIISLKHCFPGSNIIADEFLPDSRETKTLGNYKYLYNELKKKFSEYPDTKFIVWTNAALVKSATNEEEALRTREWVRWVKEEWDTPDDNIYIFDFYNIETEGELYLKPEYAASDVDSHPNKIVSTAAAEKFVDFLTSVIKQ